VLNDLRVRLRFVPGGPGEARRPPESPHPFEKLFQGLLLNYEQAIRWRTGPPATRRGPCDPPGRADAYRLVVEKAGICCLTRAYLLANGLPIADVDPRTFRVFARGQETALWVLGEEDGTFDPGDCIKFWAEPNYRDDPRGRETPVGGKYSEGNVYWLSWGEATGLRMVTRDVTPSASAQQATHYPWTCHAERDHHPFVPHEQAIGGDQYGDEWFWEELRSGTMLPDSGAYHFWLHGPALQLAQGCSCQVRIALNGLTEIESLLVEHQAILRLNGQHLATVVWGGDTEEDQEFLYDTRRPEFQRYVPMDWLWEGQNQFQVVLPGLPFEDVYDAVYVDWFELDYWRRYEAVSDTLRFRSPAAQEDAYYLYEVSGFSQSALELYELAADGPVRLTGFTVAQGLNGYELTFADSSVAGRDYYTTAEGLYVLPSSVQEDEAYQFPSGAGYVIITHEELEAAAEMLLAQWVAAEPDLEAVVVPIQEIYDGFWWGVFDPRAIREFLSWAYAAWDPAPAHVLILGDATWDYKQLGDDSDPDHRNFVPSWGNPAWDDYFALVDGHDLLPDLVMGRLPVENADTAWSVAGKLSSYLQGTIAGPWQERVLMAADYYEDLHPWEFRNQSEAIIDSFVLPEPAFFKPETVYKDDGTYYPPYESFAERDSIIAIINRGCALANYVGHGATWCWGCMLWGFDIQEQLVNSGMLPFVLSWTCHTARFANPSLDSFAEEWLWKEAGGAVGFVGTTGWGHTGYDKFQMSQFFEELLTRENRRIGEALLASKVAFADTSIQGSYPPALEQRRESPLYFTLLGDPRMKVSLEPRPDLALDSTDLSLDPVEPIQGDVANLTVTVHNRGPDPAPGAEVRFWQDGGAPACSLGSFVLPTISAGDSASASCQWPTSGLLGPYYLVAMVDPDSLIEEGREWNNTAGAWFEVQPRKPDLAVQSSGIAFEPPVPNPADSVVSISAWIHNVGTGDAPGFEVAFRDGDDTAPGELLGSIYPEQLLSGDSTLVVLAWPIDDTMAGHHVVWCIADPNDALDELNEENNTATAAVDILTRVELLVGSDDIVFSNPSPPEGDPLGIVVTVHNAGQALAETVGLEVYIDQHPDSAGSAPHASLVADSIPGGGTADVSTQWSTIGQAGQHTVYAVADPENRFQELDEDNNRASREVTVLALPDLLVSSTDSYPAVPIEGDTVTIRAVVRNAGMVQAPAFTVEFFVGPPEQGDVLALWDGVELPGTTAVTLETSWTATPGTQQFWIRLDHADAVEESNEQNNTEAIQLTVLTKPDLIVTGDVPSDTLLAGDTLWVACGVENLGEAPAHGTEVSLLWEEQPYSWSTVSSVTLGSIAGLDTVVLSLPWEIVSGEHLLQAWVYAASAESDTSNNRDYMAIVARERRGADAYLAGGFLPAQAVEGDTIRFEGVVGNQGEVAAHQVVITVFDPAAIAVVHLGDLGTGEETPVVLRWVPEKGVHNYRAVVSHAAAESDTSDNEVTGQVIILGRPDLYCHSLQVSPGAPQEGDTVLIAATIGNAGDLEAQGYAVGVLVDELFRGLYEMVPLEGGAQTDVSMQWHTTGEPGDHVVTVWADPDTRIEEGCETNNTVSQVVSVDRDSIGPTLSVQVVGVSQFRAGDPLWVGTPIRFALRDAGTGIDTSSVQVTLDGRRLRPGQDFTITGSGREVWVEAVVSPRRGEHTVAVAAVADRAGNQCGEVPLRVTYTSCTDLEIAQFLAHPNPTSGPTEFLCLYPPVDGEDVRIEIFTLSGRLIRRLVEESGPSRYTWDGKDGDGDHVANGVYMARLQLRCSRGRVTRLTRLVVLR
jgi:subtilase family serine protease